MTETERLFFALWPDQALRELIYKASLHAVRHSGGRPVPPENYHITLAFLGNLTGAQAERTRIAASSVRATGFDLVLDRLGHWASPKVLWLGANQEPKAARQLADGLVAALRIEGLALDPKPFVPHVTLARKVEKYANISELAAIKWQITAYSLIRSIINPAGSNYAVLASWPLAAPERNFVE